MYNISQDGRALFVIITGLTFGTFGAAMTIHLLISKVCLASPDTIFTLDLECFTLNVSIYKHLR